MAVAIAFFSFLSLVLACYATCVCHNVCPNNQCWVAARVCRLPTDVSVGCFLRNIVRRWCACNIFGCNCEACGQCLLATSPMQASARESDYATFTAMDRAARRGQL